MIDFLAADHTSIGPGAGAGIVVVAVLLILFGTTGGKK
jgi:hypothetical protein